jgi:Na+/H+ antiporter NhaD/arsenite permease-like protein
VLTGTLVFAVTYVLVALRRLEVLPLGRPGAALIGAVATVALGVLDMQGALAAIDGHTLVLLFGMMAMGAFLELDGFFARAEAVLSTRARTAKRLLAVVVWGSGLASALITNDAVCVFGAPLVVALIRRHALPPLPFLLALATSANTGSVATLVGNPQNMLCASLGGLDYRTHLIALLPVAVLGLALNHLLILAAFGKVLDRPLAAAEPARLFDRRSIITFAVIGLTVIVYLLGADLAFTAVAGAMVLLVVHRRDADQVWRRVDWSVLIFFAALFVVVGGLVKSGAPGWLFSRFPLWAGEGAPGWARLSAIFLLGSNVVSNVPFILVIAPEMKSLPDPRLGWELLAMASTFAGNLTLLGSVANVIVAENAREIGGLGFWDYLKVGLPLALATTALGTAWLLLVL